MRESRSSCRDGITGECARWPTESLPEVQDDRRRWVRLGIGTCDPRGCGQPPAGHSTLE